MQLSAQNQKDAEKQAMAELLSKYIIYNKNGSIYIRKNRGAQQTPMSCSDLMRKSQSVSIPPAGISDALMVTNLEKQLEEAIAEERRLREEAEKVRFEEFKQEKIRAYEEKHGIIELSDIQEENEAVEQIIRDQTRLRDGQHEKLNYLQKQLGDLMQQLAELRKANEVLDDRLNSTRMEISVIVHERGAE